MSEYRATVEWQLQGEFSYESYSRAHSIDFGHDLRLPGNGVAVLTVVLGLVHGFLNGVVLRQGAGGLGLLGIMTALFVLVALASAFVVSLERPWTRIAVRVAGSWVAASGLLLLGWAFRGPLP